HQALFSGFDIQAQHWFCIGWAHIEPPVLVVNSNAIHVIYGFCVLAILLYERIQFGLDIAYAAIDLTAANPLVQWHQQFRKRLSLNRDKFQCDEKSDEA